MLSDFCKNVRPNKYINGQTEVGHYLHEKIGLKIVKNRFYNLHEKIGLKKKIVKNEVLRVKIKTGHSFVGVGLLYCSCEFGVYS